MPAPAGMPEQENDMIEINFENGRNCGAGYDVFGYASGRRAAALVRHLPTRRAIYVDLSGLNAKQVYSACAIFAAGADVPKESDAGAEALWDEMEAKFEDDRLAAKAAGLVKP
jgi:hypothetical protein